MHVLAFNSGSSSLKYGVYRVEGSTITTCLDEATTDDRTPDERVDRILQAVVDAGLPRPDAIGHRIVHGGPALRRHCRIDDAVMTLLEEAIAFAPLHAPPALAVIRAARERYPGVPQVACLDTAFHATLDERSRVLPLPKALRAEGIERYGFHGLSCESIVARLQDALPARLIVAHLGHGASVTAIRHGRSIDTSMGLTPSGGVVMGTRSGDLDPGVLLFLMRERGLDASALETLIDHRSGLLGISGTSSDMRALRDPSNASADARLAIEMFCHSVARQVAGMIVGLGGVDRLVFTGGIGEHDAESRATIASRLACIGVTPDLVGVMPAQEEERIARHACDLAA